MLFNDKSSKPIVYNVKHRFTTRRKVVACINKKRPLCDPNFDRYKERVIKLSQMYSLVVSMFRK